MQRRKSKGSRGSKGVSDDDVRMGNVKLKKRFFNSYLYACEGFWFQEQVNNRCALFGIHIYPVRPRARRSHRETEP
jgi:hypothetical protein